MYIELATLRIRRHHMRPATTQDFVLLKAIKESSPQY